MNWMKYIIFLGAISLSCSPKPSLLSGNEKVHTSPPDFTNNSTSDNNEKIDENDTSLVADFPGSARREPIKDSSIGVNEYNYPGIRINGCMKNEYTKESTSILHIEELLSSFGRESSSCDCIEKNGDTRTEFYHDIETNTYIVVKKYEKGKLLTQEFLEYSSEGLILSKYSQSIESPTSSKDVQSGKNRRLFERYRYDCSGKNTVAEIDIDGDGTFDKIFVAEYSNEGNILTTGYDDGNVGRLKRIQRYSYDVIGRILMEEYDSADRKTGQQLACEYQEDKNAIIYYDKNGKTDIVYRSEEYVFNRDGRLLSRYLVTPDMKRKVLAKYRYDIDKEIVEEFEPVDAKYIKRSNYRGKALELTSIFDGRSGTTDSISEECWSKLPSFTKGLVERTVTIFPFVEGEFMAHCTCYFLKKNCEFKLVG